MSISRRDFSVGALAGMAAASGIVSASDIADAKSGRSVDELVRDEEFWRPVQNAFPVDRSYANFNNGSTHPSSAAVVKQTCAMYREINGGIKGPPLQLVAHRKALESVRRQLAGWLGCEPEGLALTPNTTTGLMAVQFGVPLSPGDEILTTKQDYLEMIAAFQQRSEREGITFRMFDFPTPGPDARTFIDLCEQHITEKTKILLVCHVYADTGYVAPVKEICAMARSKGVITMVDGAHAPGNIDFELSDLGCDIYAASLHKWTGGPLGSGFLYVRPDLVEHIYPLFPVHPMFGDPGGARKFEKMGTRPLPHIALPPALELHQALGKNLVAARLRYLRDLWAQPLSAHPRVEFTTNFDKERSSALGSFVVRGRDLTDIKLELQDRYKVIVGYPIGWDWPFGIRVTAGIHSTPEEIAALNEGLRSILSTGQGKA